MIVQASQLKTSFYDKLQGQRVLILVSMDIDALCACKILQHLLQCDHVLYTVVPVSGKQDMELAFMEHSAQVKFVILINCGANINLTDVLQPPEGIIFYICDSHRPIDVYNLYNEDQVFVVINSTGDEEFPAYNDIFQFHEGELTDEEDDGEGGEDRWEAEERRIEKRRAKREWEEKRANKMFEYTKYSYYGPSVAVLMFELAWKMSRDTNELLLCAVVGLCDYKVNFKMERDKIVLGTANIQPHVMRHNHRGADDDGRSNDCMRIQFEKELQLLLYRHWSLWDAFNYSAYTACHFKLWSYKGQKRLSEFFADLGLPLTECKQQYQSMGSIHKSNIQRWIEEKAEKYKLDNIVCGSFIFQHGFTRKITANDFVLAAGALLESPDAEQTATDRFQNTMQCLSFTTGNGVTLDKGVELAKKQSIAIYKQVQGFLETNQVINSGPFLYASVQPGEADVSFFSHPICLMSLARYLLSGFVAQKPNKKIRELPLILSVNCVDDLLIVGIPPISEASPRSFFGKAFEQAAEKTHSRILADSFNQSVIQIKAEDCSKFLDELILLMQD